MELSSIRDCSLALVTLLILYGCASDGVAVEVLNRSGSEIRDLSLEYTGGRKVTGLLLPQQSTRQRVNPTGESALIVGFSIDGKDYRQELDVYIEEDYGGHLVIVISEDGKTDFESHIRL